MSTPTPPIDPDAELRAAVRQLVDVVQQLVEQGETAAVSMSRLNDTIRRRVKYYVLGFVASFGLALVFGFVGLDNRARIEQSEQRWCPLLSILVPQPGEPAPAPATAAGPSRAQLVAARATALYDAYGCLPARSK